MLIVQDIVVLICGLISLIYLLNPTAGVIEVIPDNIPIIGNLDEAAATMIMIKCIQYFGEYFGMNFTDIFKRSPKRRA